VTRDNDDDDDDDDNNNNNNNNYYYYNNDVCTVVSTFTPAATDRFRPSVGSFIRTITVSLRDTLPKISVMGHVVQ
jgi:hypothetical protein